MKRSIRALAIAAALLLGYSADDPAFAQKAGGILKISHFDSPASMSLLEGSTAAALRPMMGVFNNLAVYDQHVAQKFEVGRPGPCYQLVLERRGDRADLPAAPGRQMA